MLAVIREVLQLLVTADVPSPLILLTLIMEAIRYVLPKRRFLQEPHCVTPEDGVLHSHRRGDLESYKGKVAPVLNYSVKDAMKAYGGVDVQFHDS
jgi:hypothetical protein